MKNWLREYLGINEVLTALNRLELEDIRDLHNRQINMQRTLGAIGPGLGRVIAKLDPQYGRSEFDPARKAESDKLAEETIKRLEAEAAARAPHNQT